MRPDDEIDRSLVARARKGDVNAFEDLVRKYQKLIYVLCHRITGAPQAADDLSQETFVKAYVALPHFIDGHDFYPWLRRIALNTCFNFLKKWKRERPLVGEEKVAPRNLMSAPHESLPQEAERREMERKFREAFRLLPPDQKIVFSLRVFENMSYAEIAQTLRLPTGTVMSRLNRARKKLRARLADHLRRS